MGLGPKGYPVLRAWVRTHTLDHHTRARAPPSVRPTDPSRAGLAGEVSLYFLKKNYLIK
ncbi:hypothetical protein CsatB_009958 [Cannabis sativa]